MRFLPRHLLGRVSLGGRLLVIIIAVVVLDFVINSVVFERAQLYAIREDDAAWMAEDVVVAHRILERSAPADRNEIASELSTEHFTFSWSRRGTPAINPIELSTLHRQMLDAEPELQTESLQLKLMPLSAGGNIGGSTRLNDGSVLNFQFAAHAPWSLNFGRLIGLAVPSLLLLLMAWLAFRVMLAPLRNLVKATSEVGSANQQPIPETGEGDIRQLISAFNAMQDRIRQLLASGSETLLAIGHDLRTPLARMHLRLENADIDPQLKQDMGHDIHEMLGLLESLQTYVESGRDAGPLERIDIAVTAQTLVDSAQDRGFEAEYAGPSHLEIEAHPVAIRRALSNLVENALAYAGDVRVAVTDQTDGVLIEVKDSGPGIPEDRLDEVLRPFIRLDNARARNTAGMGLGLPIVDRVVKADAGTLTLSNRPNGGLCVAIRLPKETA